MRSREALVAVAAATLFAVPAADAASLPSVSSGARPGPDVLYAPPPSVPQLENSGPWSAPPILVSGATAYRGGEFLYQDYLYDDYGAAGLKDPADPMNPAEYAFSPKKGTITYPTDPVFVNNAADLVELRVKRVPGATAFRVTVNSLKDPSRTAFTIALGSSPAPRAWPHGAGVSSPAQLFLTVHGTAAELRDAATNAMETPAPTATVDLRRRQYEVRVPDAAWNPGTSKVRMAAGVGLWDTAARAYLKPAATASRTRPGGAGATNAALFNLAFRTNEPKPKISQPGVANTVAEGAVGTALDGTWWRERAQAEALASGDVSAFSATVDFAKLAAGSNDDSQVPKVGHFNRILGSRFSFGQGVDHSKACGLVSPADPCEGRYRGQLQPYAVYVPSKPRPAGGFGLTLLMHGLSANYNEFLDSKNAQQFGDRGAGTIVVSPFGRAPDGFYKDYAEADVFEVWADVARRYPLDPSFVGVSGYSMGGIGTLRLISRWPDLFARGFPIVGYATDAANQLESLRNVPIMMWNAVQDELVNSAFVEQTRNQLEAAGVRYDLWRFNPAGHITLGNNDEYGPAAAFLGNSRVDRNPAHVTYVLDPADDEAKAKVVADHAYWISGLKRAGSGTGKIDAHSRGFGLGEPSRRALSTTAGALTGGSHGPLPYTRQTRELGPTPKAPKANRLDIRSSGLAAATIAPKRARLTCDADIHITSDRPIAISLAGCGRTASNGCLAKRSPIASKAIGRIRLRRTRRQLRRLRIQPRRRTQRTYRYCVRGSSGRVTAVFSSRRSKARVRLVTSTAKLHRSRKVGSTSSATRLARAFPRRRRIARGLYRLAPGSRRIVGVRRGRVRFVGVADRRLLRSPRTLRRYLRRAGL